MAGYIQMVYLPVQVVTGRSVD